MIKTYIFKSLRLPAIASLILTTSFAAHAGTLTICNYSSTTYYLALRKERSFLLGGGYYTEGWQELAPDHGIFNSCWSTTSADGWSEYYVFRSSSGEVILDLTGTHESMGDISACVDPKESFSYTSSSKGDSACSADYELNKFSFGIRFGQGNTKLTIN